jgi:hypothetical protein
MQFREICSGQPHGETRVWQLQTPRVPALLEQLSTKFLRKSMSGRALHIVAAASELALHIVAVASELALLQL